MRIIPRVSTPILVFVALFLPIAAWGMAGGGGGYSSGGGGGSDGDAGFIIDVIWFLLQICIEYPAVGIPLVGTLVVLFAISCLFSKDKGKDAYQGHIIRKGNSILIGAQLEQAVEKLKSSDPQFSMPEFLNRVHGAFVKIQQAWCNQDMQQAQAFVSDGIVERFTLQLQEQRDLGYRDRMDDLHVFTPDLAQASIDTNFDTVTVRVASQARDYRVNLKDGSPLTSVPPPRDYSEYWSFMRRRGAKTIPGKPGLMEGKCPNCGAGIEMNQSANCQQCSALLRSGEYDWVLAEITQECEWRGNVPASPPGLAAMQALDPDFNLQHIEDRVSVMFWRRMECGRKGKIDPLRKMASDACCESVAPQLMDKTAAGQRSWWGECAVGSVDTIGLKIDAQRQSALVEVRWAGTQFISKSGQPAVRTDEKTLTSSLYLIARRPGVKTESKQLFSSAHCPGCGAPERLTIANACEFCGIVQNDGSRDWVLERIEPAVSAEGRALMGEFKSVTIEQPREEAAALPGLPLKGGTVSQLAWVIHMCASDGEITARERKWIDKVAERWSLPHWEVEQMIDAALKGSIHLPEPQDRAEANLWLRDMTRSALADGALSGPEEKLLIATGQRYNYSPADIRLMVSTIKRELYVAAKHQIRETNKHKSA